MSIATDLLRICGHFDFDKAVTAAMEILDVARKLDVTLRTQKAEFFWYFGKGHGVPTPRFGFPLDDGSMEDCVSPKPSGAIDQPPTVDLVVAPALFKRGNNDGAQYDTVSCCIKMKVVCCARTFSFSSGNPLGKQLGSSRPPYKPGNIESGHVIKHEGTDKAMRRGSHASAPPDLRLAPVKNHKSLSREAGANRGGKQSTSAQPPKSNPIPEASGPGGKTSRKRKARSDDDDDPKDGDYQP